jgi:glutathione S-transferase
MPSASRGTSIELWQFRFSMYPEKARWALDFKGVPHVRRSLLPGPHVVQVFLRAGQKALPVLCDGKALIKGSAAILAHLEQRYPAPALLPADPQQAKRALELQAWFDEIGPMIRRAFFCETLPATDYAADLFSSGYSGAVRRLYRASFPLVRQVMRLDMRISRAGAEAGRIRTQEALDFVARNQTSAGYLVGDTFTVADLTAAAVLNPVVLAAEYPLDFPEPRPPAFAGWLKRWEAHPGSSWVREMYRRHRGRSMATLDRNG